MTALRVRSPALPLAGFGVLAAAVYATAAAVVASPLFVRAPEVGAGAVTFDLLVTVPFFFWLLVIRRTGLPWISIVPFFLLSLAAASLVLPDDSQRYLALARMAVVPAEIALLAYAAFRVRAFLGRGIDSGGDVLAGIRGVLREMIPARPVADVAAAEVALVWYALLSWRAQPEVARGEMAFTAHEASGLGGMVGALVVGCVIEALGVHLLVARWSPATAWALTALTAYGIVWLVGLARSVALRPTTLGPGGLRVRVGVLWEMAIPVDRISAVTPGTAESPGRDTLKAALLTTPRLTIDLSEEMEATGLYGQRKRGITRIALYVDRPKELAAELQSRMDR
ncbi:MAG TPA: hypothetical protein VFR81_02085 [Longimicrobium sp.]|nr:hypothetical protein [Longimicrobium sp.]